MCVSVYACILFVYLGHYGEQCASITRIHLGPVSEGCTASFWLHVSLKCGYVCLDTCARLCGFYVFPSALLSPGLLFFPHFTSVCQFWCDGLSPKGLWWVRVLYVCLPCAALRLSQGKCASPTDTSPHLTHAINQRGPSCLRFLSVLLVAVVSEGNSVIHYLFERDRKYAEYSNEYLRLDLWQENLWD